MKLIFTLLLTITLSTALKAQSTVGIISAVPSKDTINNCESVTVTITGGHAYLQTILTGNTHTLTGSIIRITVGYQDPAIGSTVITGFTTTHTITGLNPGTYSILVLYGSSTGGVTTSLTY